MTVLKATYFTNITLVYATVKTMQQLKKEIKVREALDGGALRQGW